MGFRNDELHETNEVVLHLILCCGTFELIKMFLCDMHEVHLILEDTCVETHMVDLGNLSSVSIE